VYSRPSLPDDEVLLIAGDLADSHGLQALIIAEQVYHLGWQWGLMETTGPVYGSYSGLGIRLSRESGGSVYVSANGLCRETIRESFERAFNQVGCGASWLLNVGGAEDTLEFDTCFSRFDSKDLDNAIRRIITVARARLKLFDASCLVEITRTASKTHGAQRKVIHSERVKSTVTFRTSMFVDHSAVAREDVLVFLHCDSQVMGDSLEELMEARTDEYSRMRTLKSVNQYKGDLVVAPGAGGILVHEACGHLLEADTYLGARSVFVGRLGSRVCDESISIVDCPSAFHWISDEYDAEGSRTIPIHLIRGGFLEGLMTCRETARPLGLHCTGNARVQSYEYEPIPRMRNTYIENGRIEPSSIIKDTQRGIYASCFSHGQVNPETGDFVFGVMGGYYIEQGVLTVPVKPFLYHGNALGVLARIDAVGNDLAFRVSKCGKKGQLVDVAHGQPTVRIVNQVLGG